MAILNCIPEILLRNLNITFFVVAVPLVKEAKKPITQ
jgi:hypothetical protein